jgi:dipeptidyl aminopeptidase/acylaminoacyl peptidase
MASWQSDGGQDDGKAAFMCQEGAMEIRYLLGLALASALLTAGAQAQSAEPAKPFDAAAAFGAREGVTNLSLSPDGSRVAYVAPTTGQGSVVLTRGFAADSPVKQALAADGNPERIERCDWLSNERLVCTIYGVVADALYSVLPFTRVIAVNADGSNLVLLSRKDNIYTRGLQLGGGKVINWLADEEDAVLMTRRYLPDEHLGSRGGSYKNGLGVDRIDTRTVAATSIEPPRADAEDYFSDARGTVRIMSLEPLPYGKDTGVMRYLYRTPGSRAWQPLSEYHSLERSGFAPFAIDQDLDVAYGFKRKDGRQAFYSMALDGSKREQLIYERPDVDVDGLIRIGRRQRVVGLSYATDVRSAVYFDPDIQKVMASLSKALPGHPALEIVDSSTDESKLLIFATSDQDPGVYYLFDRTSHHLDTFLVARAELEGVKLAVVKPVSYPADDGTMIPGYLTLPPGREDAKGLPAIVLPHGGPSARDEWGFDWLPQFFAARGFAVLQPNFRGSSGYGDAWFEQNGFKSWAVAIGDVLAAGHWLVAQGIADPAKLGIVGWSYGGYAALQSAVVEPTLFKAVVAIAPVTDLESLKLEHRDWSDYEVVSAFVGEGLHLSAGSPADHADKIKSPVLLFHGTLDRNVSFRESKKMAARLTAAGGRGELVTFDQRDHYLEDSAARTELLRKSDAFLRSSMDIKD